MAAKKKAEPRIAVGLRPAVAKDVITVLRKFSEQRMEKLLPGEHDKASRLLDINLFRADLEEALREAK